MLKAPKKHGPKSGSKSSLKALSFALLDALRRFDAPEVSGQPNDPLGRLIESCGGPAHCAALMGIPLSTLENWTRNRRNCSASTKRFIWLLDLVDRRRVPGSLLEIALWMERETEQQFVDSTVEQDGSGI